MLMTSRMGIAGIAAPVLVESGWNPLDKDAGITLSNGNRDAVGTNNSGNQDVRGSLIQTSGSQYFEVEVLTNSAFSGVQIGAMTAAAALTSPPGYQSGGFGLNDTGRFYIDGTNYFGPNTDINYAAGDIIMVAIKFSTAYFWFGKNGVWNPATGTPGVTAAYGLPTGYAGGLYPAVTAQANGAFRSKFGASQQTYAPPSGFTPWG